MNWLWSLLGSAGASAARKSSVLGTALPKYVEEGFDPAGKLSFEETVAHMNRGYENTQRAIHFMDTKAGAVVAFSLAIFAFVGRIVAWIYSEAGPGMLATRKFPNCCIFSTIGILVVMELIAGFVCLERAFRTVRPSGLPMPDHFTSLFPAMENAWSQQPAKDYLDRLVSGEDKRFLLNEFKAQLLAVGGIIFLKIKRLQQSITALKWQGMCAILIGLVVGLLAALGELPKKETPASINAEPELKSSSTAVPQRLSEK